MTTGVTSLSPERACSLWKMRGFLTNSFCPKKFRSRHKKLVFAPTKMPDCVVIFDTERKSSVFLEAERLGIPIVALVDSSMPWEFYKKVTYPIPANDSVRFVYLICNMITKCLMLEKKKQEGAKGIGRKATIKDEVESTVESEGSASDEVLVVPYDNLAPISGVDIAESKKLLDKLVVVKFNGALGKNMGFGGPMSLIEVKNGSTLLDSIVNQIQLLNSKYGCNIPLLLMNSKRMHNDILKVLEKYSSSDIDIHPFEQGKQTPHESFVSKGGEDEWQSSDHGTQFLSLMNSGTLDILLAQGKEYALVVNLDNVAGVVDPKILNHLAQNSIEYCSEVTATTSTGLINFMASSLQGKLKLEDFTSDHTQKLVKVFEFIDTRNLWLNLKAIKRLVDTSALNLDNLSTFKSDLYSFTEGILVRNDIRISDFKCRFKTIPSIVKLDRLEVIGDVWFGADIVLRGKVVIDAIPGLQLRIPDGVVLEDEEIKDPSDI